VIKAVLDTVVFVRALINPQGPSGKIIKKIEKFEILTSPLIKLPRPWKGGEIF